MGEPSVVIAAVDLGASSGRVVVGRGDRNGFTLHEVHRFVNRPVRTDGTLRWDAASLHLGVIQGLRAAVSEFGRLDAVSVDGWGVDYGLIHETGELIVNPAHYRDPRTARPFAQVAGGDRNVTEAQLYAATGIASHPFNTVFQLMAERDGGALADARHVLLMPDLVTYWLSGAMGTEVTNASTTSLLDPRTMSWASEPVDALGIPIGLFPSLRSAGDIAGSMSASVVAELGLASEPLVVIGPSHDTAAAVAGVPAEGEEFAYVCTGTWTLVGLELAGPVINEAGRGAGFSNEVGVDGTIRFLRNVTGFWLVQECVREWQLAGKSVDLDRLTAAAADLPLGAALIDVQDPAFTAPDGMPQRIRDACLRTSGADLSTEAETLRCILDSMAVAIRAAIRDAMRIAGRSVRTVHVVGGGVANTLFCQLVADACRRPVVAGPTEAASWGNVLVQARAIGAVTATLPDLRAIVRLGSDLVTYWPRGDDSQWQRADDVVLASRSAGAG